MRPGTQRIHEVDIAKGIGILLVVFGHSVPDANIGIQNALSKAVFDWVYSFHMALFMAMAGILFFRKANRCVVIEQCRKEIGNRAQRLLIPYLFYSFAMLLAKMATSLGRTPLNGESIHGILFGNSPCGNMWFLWTLFVLSSLILLIPYGLRKPEYLTAIAAVLYLFQNTVEWFERFGINKVLNMLVWFALGMCIGKLLPNMRRKPALLGTSLLAGVSFLVQGLMLQKRSILANIFSGGVPC